MAILAAALIAVPNASAQTTAFTYQGQLKNGGSPANGSYDMTFRLFDDAAAGNQVGTDLPFTGVSTANGLFTITLDFGPGVFTGVDLWLEIDVNGTTLSPRQALTPTPYSQTAGYANAPWQTTGADLYYTDGNVGIGTSAPTARFEVAGTPGVDGIKFPDGTMQLSAAVAGSGYWSANGSSIYNNNTGSVGIGTQTPVGSFEVKKPGHTLISGGALGVTGDSTPFPAAAGNGVFLTGGAGGAANIFAFDYGAYLPISLVLQTPGGNVGIGTASPTDRLNVKTATSSYGITHTDGTITVGTYVGGAGNGGYLGTRSNHPLHLFTHDSGPLLTVSTNGNVGIGTTTPGAKLEVSGRTITHSLQIIGGADLAEPFDVAGESVPGMVVVIDPAHPGSLMPCNRSYDRKVAGIVSGAGGVATGLSMGQEGTLADGKHPVALSGRVYCLVDASQGAIEPGDMLTTSGEPGHAMKASDFDHARGAIIGKAMTSLAAGKGLVLVLVNLQ